jgi:hypothetical protein
MKNYHVLDFAVLIGIVTLEAAVKGAAVIIALIIAITAPAPAHAPAPATASPVAITAAIVHQPLTVDQLIANHTQRELMTMAGTKSKRSKQQLAERILQQK